LIRRFRSFGAMIAAFGVVLGAGAASARPHNVIIFVADGLRSRIVTPETAPALAAVRAEGVDFQNSHSLYPTVTTVNAAAIATGHGPGDSGDFGNTLYVAQAFPPPFGTPFASLEDDVVLDLMNQRYGGDYLGRTSLLRAAEAKGYATAVVGKLGPAAIQDVTARGERTIVIDDGTGASTKEGVPLAPDLVAAIKAAGLPTTAPDRGLNSWPGAYNMPGVQVANVDQQAWFTKVVTDVLLPRFKAQDKPFVLVVWSRDPDGTQHNQGDSLNSLVPGINGPTSMAAIRNASDNLASLRAAVKALGLEADTDIVVTADHGFSTLSHESATSGSTKAVYRDVKPGFMPPGFLALDLGQALGLPVMDPAGYVVKPATGAHPRSGVFLGKDANAPDVAIAANGGSDLIYLPGPRAAELAPRIVEALSRQDYTGAIFVDDRFGPIPGALPMSAVGLVGDARTPRPAIYVAFRSFSTGCADAELCGAIIGDSELSQGEGMHGSFGRQDTHNFMAAVGPDFRAGFVDPAPVSNADLAPTLAHILGLELNATGAVAGRVAAEALRDGPAPAPAQPFTETSAPAGNGFVTVLEGQAYADRRYYDAAGMPGRTLGLKAAPK
jgi:arylsulfatase A-like enzyme